MVSHERAALADFLAQGDAPRIASFIARDRKFQRDITRFYGPELDIKLLIGTLRTGNAKQIEDIRDFIDRYVERRAGKMPVNLIPLSVRRSSSVQEAKENASLSVRHVGKSLQSFGNKQVLRGIGYACKGLTDAIAATLSATGLKVRERQLAMALGLQLTIAAPFIGNAQAAVNHDDINDILSATNQSGYGQTMELPTAPLQITVTRDAAPDGSLRGEFGDVTFPFQEDNYYLSPYLVKKLQDDGMARQYMGWIVEASVQYEHNPVIVANQLFRETIHFNPEVISCERVSPKDARGFGQFTEETGKKYGLVELADFCDPRKNIFAAAEHMRDLANNYNGDLMLALAAYNGGPGAVDFVRGKLGRSDITGQEWLDFMNARYAALGETDSFAWHVETREYVADITGQNWTESYQRWAANLQGDNPLHYAMTFSKQAPTQAVRAIDLALTNNS